MGVVKEKRDQGGHPTADRPGSLVILSLQFSWQVQHLVILSLVFVAGAAFSDSVLAVFVAGTAFGNIGMEGIKPRVWRNAES